MASIFTYTLGVEPQMFPWQHRFVLVCGESRCYFTSPEKMCQSPPRVFVVVCDCEGVAATPLSAPEFDPPLQAAPPRQSW